MNPKIFDTLERIAVDLEPASNTRLAAAIVYRNRIISLGVNQMKSHPMQAKFCKHESAVFWHAENNSIFNAIKNGHQDLMHKCQLYVLRVKRNIANCDKFIWGSAKPCIGCEKAIKYYGIKTVHYTLDSSLEEQLSATKNFLT